jgi:uncharacterized protein (DUF342 family)
MPDLAFSFKNILDKDTQDYGVRAESDPAGMQVRAFLFPKKPEKFPSPEALSLMLRDAGVVHGLDLNAIKLACSVAALGNAQTGVVLAKGTLPVNGEDEHIKFRVQPNSDRRKMELLDKDRLAGEALPLLANVLPDEEIGHLESPTGGLPGMTVFGIPIPAKDGAPMRTRPLAGEGVVYDKVARSYFASVAGRVVMERETLSVSSSYTLIGDVNRRTGDIAFVGDLEITGNIADSFKVKARSIKLRGHVGDCLLEASGDISIGSMNGALTGAILCGGSLTASALDGCTVEVKGDIFVRNWINKCVIRCGGAIIAKAARLEGGSVTAFKGIDVLNLGSTHGTRTGVGAGRCPFTEKKLQKLNREFRRKSRKMNRLQHMIAPYVYDKAKLDKLRPEAKASVDRMSNEFRSLNKELIVLGAEIDALSTKQKREGAPQINVRGILMRGAVITLGCVTQEILMPCAARSPSGRTSYGNLGLPETAAAAGRIRKDGAGLEEAKSGDR